MTARHPDTPDEPDLLPDADSEALGRRIQELALTVEAPASLRTRLADDAQRAAKPRRRRFGLPAAVAGGLAAVVAVVAVLAGVGGDGSPVPSVDDAAALALARPTAAAPAIDGSNTMLDASVGGITFPNYAYQWPAWKAAGERHDTLDGGRAATTITYRGPKGDVGYTIVDGTPLPEPSGARTIRSAGITLKVYDKDGATVVTWRRDGHTCVLAGRGKGVERQLVKFATWA